MTGQSSAAEPPIGHGHGIAPVPGTPIEVARGVYLLRMPLPFRLDHINLYLLDDPAGWTLVDCGLDTPETIALWERLFATFLRDKPVARVLVTHLHPDHIGLAHWLQARTGAPVCMTEGEWVMAHDLFELPVKRPARLQAHYEQLGMAGGELQAMVQQAGGFRKLVKALPPGFERLTGGDVLEVGGRRWQVIIGRGHSPECACLWDESEGILIAGDHILPSISPNINLLAVGPQDPLADYLASLPDFESLPCKSLLPAHGLITGNSRERAGELRSHHERHLERLEGFCRQPRSALDCVPQLFRGPLPDHQMYFAIGEAAAHLVYLEGSGRLRRTGERPWMFRSL